MKIQSQWDNPRVLSDQDLIGLASNLRTDPEEPTELANELYVHFECTGLSDWCDIAAEGTRILLLTTDDLPPDVAGGCDQFIAEEIISAVAAQANTGAYIEIARALNINAKELEWAVSHVIDDGQKPFGIGGLAEHLADARKDIDATEQAHARSRA